MSAIQAISIHYCHGNFESIEIFDKNPNCCGHEHSDHKACCKDILIKIDFDSDHIYTESLNIQDPTIEENPISYLLSDFSFSELSPEKNETYELIFAPPPLKLYVLNNSFIFYG